MTTRREIARIPIPKDAEDAKRLRAAYLLGISEAYEHLLPDDSSHDCTPSTTMFPLGENGTLTMNLPKIVTELFDAGRQVHVGPDRDAPERDGQFWLLVQQDEP